MKRFVTILLLCVVVSVLFAGCGTETADTGIGGTSQSAAIGNPWSDWTSMEEAEAAVGFSFGIPEVIADSFTAAAFRTLNDELIEIIYLDGDCEICVRKMAGEDQDISGDYNQYDICTEETIDGGTIVYYYNSGNNAVKQLISYKSYSWSLVAPNGCGDNSDWSLVRAISE